MTQSKYQVIAIVEDGYWRVKDVKVGVYLCSNCQYDEWHEDVRWRRRQDLSDSGWHGLYSTWGVDDPELGMENGRAARMIAAFADTVMRQPSQ